MKDNIPVANKRIYSGSGKTFGMALALWGKSDMTFVIKPTQRPPTWKIFYYYYLNRLLFLMPVLQKLRTR